MNWTEIKRFFASLTLEKLVPVLLILVIGLVLVRVLLKLFDRALNRSKLDRTLFGFLRATMRVLLDTVVLLIAISSLGVDVTSLVALLSVVSLAISLAVQNTLSNVVGGFTLLVTHPFRVGDFVEIGTESGTVREIKVNYTLIVALDGHRIFIPNSDISSARIRNYTAEGRRRIKLSFSASYEDPVEKVKAAALAAADHPLLIEPPKVYLSEYADSGIVYTLYLWAAPADYYTVMLEVNEAIKREFDKEGITIPYPHIELIDKRE